MASALGEDDYPLEYLPKFREWGIAILDGGSSVSVISYCPFCGVKLPSSLRDEWFDRLENLGLEVDDPLPIELQSDAWWNTV
ncbi:hypothetical protein [Mycobacterium sp. NPDC050441]|uniref:DUF6980 family protein n=1 Tax=Mycobacterium sp. NPDC050441 TaxID=3155403 RepID=UPI0033CE18ED